MGRPPLSIGTFGNIKVTAEGSGFVARARFRDFDGVTRLVERSGRSKTAARTSLLEALNQRAAASGNGDLIGDSKFSGAADMWLIEVRAQVDAGDRAPSTVELYERQLRNHVLPALGELRLHEVRTPRVDAVLRGMRARHGASTTKTSRTVISGVMGLAVRYGAVTTNPVREVGRIKGEAKRGPRALTPDERQQWLHQLDSDERAVRKDLPDLTRFMLATGVRIGEALAVSWDEVDLTNATVGIEWNLVRIRGEGLKRVRRVKTVSGERTLALPMFAVSMLKRRCEEGGTGPVFPDALGGWRDPSNTRRDLREARGTEGFSWVTSHVFRKTAATVLDEQGMTARQIADHLGHARPSLTQDVYLGRKVANPAAAAALEAIAGS